jgi:hypothetical protein
MERHFLTKTSVEEIEVLLIDETVLKEALHWVTGCEQCSPNASIHFDYVLDAVVGADPTTEYIMQQAVKCPACSSDITEKTRITVG